VRAIRALDPAAILVFQGGGNFGDLYPDLQFLREAVVKEFTERKIVVLPQSVHFESSDAQARALDRMFGHPDIHFFMRDQPSLDLMETFSAGRSTLMPDMAHALWGNFEVRSAVRPTKPTLYMFRRDGEKRPDQPANSQGIDWEDLITPVETFGWRLARKALHTGIGSFQPTVMSAWYGLRNRLIDKAVARFIEHDRIETDRLHGMILSALVSRPVVYHDNSYGKLGRYAREWLSASPQVVSSSTKIG
jgi:pyruvyl transferase EpsO